MIKVILHQPAIVPEPQDEVLRTRGGRATYTDYSDHDENVSLKTLVSEAHSVSMSIEREHLSKYQKYNKEFPAKVSRKVLENYAEIASHFRNDLNNGYLHNPNPNHGDNGIEDM